MTLSLNISLFCSRRIRKFNLQLKKAYKRCASRIRRLLGRKPAVQPQAPPRVLEPIEHIAALWIEPEEAPESSVWESDFSSYEYESEEPQASLNDDLTNVNSVS